MDEETPWFNDIANYLVEKMFPKQFTHQQRKKFFPYLKYYMSEDPYLFRGCSDQVVRRCVSQKEGQNILKQCHSGPTGGHYNANRTIRKILDARFYWPQMFQDAQEYVLICDRCQCVGNLSHQDEMPQNQDQVCEVFDIWGIDFMGLFPNFHGNNFILVVVDYLSRWVEAQALPMNYQEWQ